MGKIFKNNCIECEKSLVSRYAKRCVPCAAVCRAESPVWRKKQSDLKKGKMPKNLLSLRLVKKMKGKFHSAETRKKMSESHRGEKSYLWRGGLTPINEQVRKNVEYRLWRESVFERDNFTCTWCYARSGKGRIVILNADHIKPFALFPELRFAIDNGRTLCVDCHLKTDTYGGRTRINKK